MTAVLLLLALMAAGTSLRAQDAATAPALGQSAATPAVSAPAAPSTPATVTAPEAGPRVAPPLERYQGSLPRKSGSEQPAMNSSGGNHTIVISTLALVLIVVIVVLLVVD